MTNIGILVVGHGSKMDYNKEAVSFHAEKLKERFAPFPVLTGFMNINEPGIDDSLNELVARGSRTIYVIPAFMANGIHTTKDITRKIGIAEGSMGGNVMVNGTEVTLKYCGPLGCDERIVDILEDRLNSRMEDA